MIPIRTILIILALISMIGSGVIVFWEYSPATDGPHPIVEDVLEDDRHNTTPCPTPEVIGVGS